MSVMAKMKIDHHVENRFKNWKEVAEPMQQLKKIKTILDSEDKKFVCNDKPYGIYRKEGILYGNHEGEMYHIDLERFLRQTDMYLENWWVPTTEGPIVDIWLIK